MLIFAKTVDLPLQMLQENIVEASVFLTVLHAALLHDSRLAIREAPLLAVVLILHECILLLVWLYLLIEGHMVV